MEFIVIMKTEALNIFNPGAHCKPENRSNKYL